MSVEAIRYTLFKKTFLETLDYFIPLKLDRVQEDILYYLIQKDLEENDTQKDISILQADIVKMLKISLSTTYRHLTKLHKLGFISIIPLQTDFGRLNSYTINYKKINEVVNGEKKARR